MSISAAQIARLAGVTPGTVATWRRHDLDFPAPAGGTPDRALYNGAEVEAWLAAAGRWELEPGPRVWREVSHTARPPWRSGAARRRPPGGGHGEAPPPACRAAWRGCQRAVDDVGAAAVVNDLLDRYAAASGVPLTPARIAGCMISLAGTGDGATRP